MKIVFYFFVTLNVAFFLWQTQATGRSQEPRPIASGAPTLILLSEAKFSEKKPKKPLKEQPDKPQKPALAACFTMGPFDGVDLARPISETLESYGVLTNTHKIKQKISSGYWVYLPAFKSWQDAREQVVKLEKKGMKDVFIMGRGSMKNAVSLGLFSNKDAAETRMGNLRKMGVKPEVEIQYVTKDQFWIDIDVQKDKADVVENINSIASSLTLLQLKKRDCS
ncbi:MAG: SPOR domain-containing protein [Gammaproteobacteria bacterium]|nr:SPOR domain-containing protein [Gammaproteobacteria bacterium]MDH5803394.1 SPOR domain-containing protein [Gammaproteobacteria bacterium]